MQLTFDRTWLKRAGWVALAIGVFVLTPFVLSVLAEVTGVVHFREIYGPLLMWNDLSAPAFVVGFVIILALMTVMMYLVLRAFSPTEGAW